MLKRMHFTYPYNHAILLVHFLVKIFITLSHMSNFSRVKTVRSCERTSYWNMACDAIFFQHQTVRLFLTASTDGLCGSCSNEVNFHVSFSLSRNI